jgi:hypothetical protein
MVRTAVSGPDADVWWCTACSRRIVLHGSPLYRRLILDAGDGSAIHAGSTGAAWLDPAELRRPDDGPDDSSWLAENGIAWEDEC